MKIEFESFYVSDTYHCVPCGSVFEARKDMADRGFVHCPRCNTLGTMNIKAFQVEDDLEDDQSDTLQPDFLDGIEWGPI